MTNKELRERLLDIVSEARLDPDYKYDDTFVDEILSLLTSDKLALLDRISKEIIEVNSSQDEQYDDLDNMGLGRQSLRVEQRQALAKLRAEQKETE